MRKTFQTFLLIMLAVICGLLALLFRHEPEAGEKPDIREQEVIWFSYQYTGSQEYQMIIAEDGGETERLMVLYTDGTEAVLETEEKVREELRDILAEYQVVSRADGSGKSGTRQAAGDFFLFYLDDESSYYVSEETLPAVFPPVRDILENAVSRVRQ